MGARHAPRHVAYPRKARLKARGELSGERSPHRRLESDALCVATRVGCVQSPLCDLCDKFTIAAFVSGIIILA